MEQKYRALALNRKTGEVKWVNIRFFKEKNNPNWVIDYATTSPSLGINDKNGREVWSGDVLDFDEEEWGDKFTPEVISVQKLISGDMKGTIDDIPLFRQVVDNIYKNI